MRDQLDALEADAALDRLVSPPPATRTSRQLPNDAEPAAVEAVLSVPTDALVGRYADRVSESELPEEQAAAHLDASARRKIARWAGNPILVQAVNELRPDFRALLDEIGINATDEKLLAAARILGLSLVDPDGIELPNPFATWPPERRGPAQLIASSLRTGVAELVERLCSSGVAGLSGVEHVTSDADTPDGLSFGFDHLELFLLFWLDIPLEGRSGAEIAADLPMLGNVGWERGRSVLLVGDASQPDILAGDTLRRVFLRRSEQASAPEQAEDTAARYRFADPKTRAGVEAEFEPPSDPIERHKLPGWGHLQELFYVANHPAQYRGGSPPQPPSRHAGRPTGPSFIQTREEVEKPYRELWALQGRRPFWREVALALGVDERTLRRVRRDLGIDSKDIRRMAE
jgi:hypothetical protein